MLAVDASALVKRYLDEDGREAVLALMATDRAWAASRLARTEADIALCRAVTDPAERSGYRAALEADWRRFAVLATDDACLARAADIGCQLNIRTLDAIHLAAVEQLPGPVRLLTFDRRLRAAAMSLGIAVEPHPVG